MATKGFKESQDEYQLTVEWIVFVNRIQWVFSSKRIQGGYSKADLKSVTPVMFRMIHNNFVIVVIIADAGRHLPFQIEGYYSLSFCYAHYSVVYQFSNCQKRENGFILESSGCYYRYLNCSDESHTTVDTDDSHLMPGLIFVCPGDHQSCTWEKCTH